MFQYTLTYKNVPDYATYADQIREANPNVIAVSVNKDTQKISITSSVEIYGAEIAILNSIVPMEESTYRQILKQTVLKEEAGRNALQEMVARLNDGGDYFTSADEGIAGSELLWPIEAFLKRGFFVFAFRKAALTLLKPEVTIYDEQTKAFFESKLRELALEFSGVTNEQLDYIKNAPEGQV